MWQIGGSSNLSYALMFSVPEGPVITNFSLILLVHICQKCTRSFVFSIKFIIIYLCLLCCYQQQLSGYRPMGVAHLLVTIFFLIPFTQFQGDSPNLDGYRKLTSSSSNNLYLWLQWNSNIVFVIMIINTPLIFGNYVFVIMIINIPQIFGNQIPFAPGTPN